MEYFNEKKFFDEVRNTFFKGKLTQVVVDNINLITDEYFKVGKDLRELAYILATTYHETASTMRPIEEYGKGKKYDYGKKLKMSRQPYTHPDKIYFGRGYVQLTWYENYEKMGKLLGVDLLNKPELALNAKIAAKIIVEGMKRGVSSRGDFTGKALEDYITPTKTDFLNARRIVNGLDKAELIKSYAEKFYKALTLV